METLNESLAIKKVLDAFAVEEILRTPEFYGDKWRTVDGKCPLQVVGGWIGYLTITKNDGLSEEDQNLIMHWADYGNWPIYGQNPFNVSNTRETLKLGNRMKTIDFNSEPEQENDND